MVVARDAGINAFATGWDEDDAVVAVTQGALDHLTREELQGLVAHEFSHIREGDTRLNMRLAGMVFGLEMIYRMGQHLFEPDERDRRMVAALLGLAIMAAGWLGWLAGHALQAAVSRQREYLADARAVQWTRSRDGLGGVLRKVMASSAGRGATPVGSMVQHMLLVGNEPARWPTGSTRTPPWSNACAASTAGHRAAAAGPGRKAAPRRRQRQAPAPAGPATIAARPPDAHSRAGHELTATACAPVPYPLTEPTPAPQRRRSDPAAAQAPHRLRAGGRAGALAHRQPDALHRPASRVCRR
jgi:hypothetical protein